MSNSAGVVQLHGIQSSNVHDTMSQEHNATTE